MVLMAEKDIDYELVRTVPAGNPSDELLKLNPLGRIPVLELDDGRVLADSLAASSYLDAAFPGPKFLPTSDWEKAWCLWLCEFVASAVFSKFEGTVFVQRVVKPGFEKVAPDEAAVAEALGDVAPAYDYLEAQLDGTEYLSSNDITLADLTAGSVLLNMRHAGEEVDATRWPSLTAYLERLHGRPSFQALIKQDLELIGHISALAGAEA
eukprot:s1_g1215.t1